MRKFLTCLVLVFGLMAPLVQANFIGVDLANWVSTAPQGDTTNSFVSIQVGPGSQVTGFDYIGLQFTTSGGSLQSELILMVENNNGSGYMSLAPSSIEEPGQFGPASGTWSPSTGSGSPFAALLDDDRVWVQVYDSYPGDGNDAVVTAGTLRVYFEPVPEPATATLFVAGGFACLRRRAY